MTPPRKAWLDALVATLDPKRDLLVAGLGANARYLPHMLVPVPYFCLCDAMGTAIPLALGMALARPNRHVTALEGDGSLLMNLGTLVTVAAARTPNLTVLLFDNHHYESSGGQRLPAVDVDFAAVAGSVRFGTTACLADINEFAGALERARVSGPALYVLPTFYDPREPIPPYSERPDEIRLNFSRTLASGPMPPTGS